MRKSIIRGPKATPATTPALRERWFRVVLWVVFAAVLASGFSTTMASASPISVPDLGAPANHLAAPVLAVSGESSASTADAFSHKVKVVASGGSLELLPLYSGTVWFQLQNTAGSATGWIKMSEDKSKSTSGKIVLFGAAPGLAYGVVYTILVAATSQNMITAEMMTSKLGPPTGSCKHSIGDITDGNNCVIVSTSATIPAVSKAFLAGQPSVQPGVSIPATTTPGSPATTTPGSPATTTPGSAGTVPPETTVGSGSPAAFNAAATSGPDMFDDPSGTLFGRYYSNSGPLTNVKPAETSPPMACTGSDYARPGTDACFSQYSRSPEQLLPAWRWRDDVGLYWNTPGLDGIAATLYSFLASTTFMLSQLAWWMLLEVSQWALTDNLVERAGGAMNRGYLLFVDTLNSSGIFFILAAFGLFVIARMFLRGRLIKVFSLILAFIVPITVMQGLAVRAAQGGKPTADDLVKDPTWGSDALPTASPAWFAVRGVNVVDGFSSWISSGLGRLSTVSGSDPIQTASFVDPSCSSYVSALYDQYYAYSSSPVRKIKAAAGREYRVALAGLKDSYFDGGGSVLEWAPIGSKISGPLEYTAVQVAKPANLADWETALKNRSVTEVLADARFYKVATVSQLWHRAFLGSWQSAQFGNQAYGAKMYCHMLESNADIHPSEQVAIARIAGRYSYVMLPDGTKISSPGYEGISAGVFESGRSSIDKEQRILAWAACNRVQGDTGVWEWKAAAGWDAFGNGKKVSDGDCIDYFTGSETDATKVRNWYGAETALTAASWLAKYGCSWASQVFCGARVFDSVISGLPIIGRFAPSSIASRAADAVRPGVFGPLKFKDNEEVDRAVAKAPEEAKESGLDPSEAFATAKVAGKTVLALKGHNGPQRLTLSILALITSIIYVYVLGFLALGTFFAKIGLVIMIILLPGTLLMMAIPSARGPAKGDGQAQARMGQKMLRMTAGFVLSHGVLSLILGFLLSVMIVLEGIVGGTGQGIGGGFIHAIIPLTALFVVRSILKAAGLGDIASAQGALGLPLSTALRAGGRDMQALGMGKFSAAADKAGLNKFDAKAKQIGTRAALAAPKAVGRKAKSWGRKLVKSAGDRMGLPEAKSYLFGDRDPLTGNLTRHGLLHRFTTLTGLFGLANDARLGRMGTKFTKRFPLPGKAWNAFIGRPGVAVRIQGSKRQLAESRQARLEWQKVAFRSKTGRIAARKEFSEAKAAEILARDFADRYGPGDLDADGNPTTVGEMIKTSDGRTVYAYRSSRKLRDAGGTVLTDDMGRDLYAVEAVSDQGEITRLTAKGLAHRSELMPQVDALGNPVLDSLGGAVYGYRFDDGKGVRVVSHAVYESLRRGDGGLSPVPDTEFTKLTAAHKDSYKEGVRYVHDKDAGSSLLRHADVLALADDAEKLAALAAPVTEFDEFRKHFTEEEIWFGAEKFREQHGLRKGQFVVSPFGLPVLRPTLESADGKGRFVIGKYLEESRDLAAFERTQYLPNHQKMMLPGEGAAAYSMRLKLQEDYLGGFGPNGEKIDIVYERTGHRFDSPRGQHELQLALEGKEGALMAWRPEIPPEVFASMVTVSSERSHHTRNADIQADYASLAAERDAQMTEAYMTSSSGADLMVRHHQEFEELGKIIRPLDGKLKLVRGDVKKAEDVSAPLRAAVKDAIDAVEARTAEYEDAAHYSDVTKSWDVSSDPSLVVVEKELLDAIKALEAAKASAEAAALDSGRALDAAKDAEAKILTELNDAAQRAKVLAAEVHALGQEVEASGKELHFGFLAMMRDKGKIDGSELDELMDDFSKEFLSRHGANAQSMESIIAAYMAASAAGEATQARMGYEELEALMKEMNRAARKAAASGSGYHLKVKHDLAVLEGDSRSFSVSKEAPSISSWLFRKGR